MEIPFENCNTATECCRFQISVDSFYSLSFSGEKKSKKVDKKFVNRNDNVVPCTRKIKHAPTYNQRSISFECKVRCYSENEKEAYSPATPLQSYNPDETLEGENRGRMKRQMTHLRSLTDLHTPKIGAIFVQ